jgi:hypothetical protein
MWRWLQWLDKILSSPVTTLPWGDPERRFLAELDERPVLDDRAFYDTYYAGSGIPEALPALVRRVYAEQLGRRWQAVRPDDRATDFMPDLDLYELILEVAEDLGLSGPFDDLEKLDGSFDSVVRYFAARYPNPAR